MWPKNHNQKRQMQLHCSGVDPERSLKGAKKNSIFLIELSCRNKPESERSQLGAKSRKVSFFDSGFFRLRIFSQKSVDFLLFYWFLIEFRGPRGYSSPYPDQPRVREKKQFLTNISSVTQIKWAIRSPVSWPTRIRRANRSPVSRPTRIRCDDPNRGSLNNFFKGMRTYLFLACLICWAAGAWSAVGLSAETPTCWWAGSGGSWLSGKSLARVTTNGVASGSSRSSRVDAEGVVDPWCIAKNRFKNKEFDLLYQLLIVNSIEILKRIDNWFFKSRKVQVAGVFGGFGLQKAGAAETPNTSMGVGPSSFCSRICGLWKKENC